MLDGFLNLPGLVYVLVYYMKPFYFLSVWCNTIKWVQKTYQVYDPKTDMVLDTHFLCLNVNNYYNHNMDSFDLSDQLSNVYLVDCWMHITLGGGLFSFGAVSSYFSIITLFTKNCVKT